MVNQLLEGIINKDLVQTKESLDTLMQEKTKDLIRERTEEIVDAVQIIEEE